MVLHVQVVCLCYPFIILKFLRIVNTELFLMVPVYLFAYFTSLQGVLIFWKNGDFAGVSATF